MNDTARTMSDSTTLGRTRLLRAYRKMKLIGEFEERLHGWGGVPDDTEAAVDRTIQAVATA